MRDPIFGAFLRTAAEDAKVINGSSDVVRLVPNPLSRDPADTYHGMFFQIEHLERHQGGAIRVTDDPIPFTLFFPEDYLRSSDRLLPFRVVALEKQVYHPNASQNCVCLGTDFRPGTRLRGLVHQLYLIVSSRVFATQDPLDLSARRYYLDHMEEIRKLRAAPLWRRPLSARASVVPASRTEPAGEGEAP